MTLIQFQVCARFAGGCYEQTKDVYSKHLVLDEDGTAVSVDK